MFKIVRKGDASLQYTILPQTDQFFGNGPPTPQPPDTRHPVLYKIIITTFIIVCFGSIFVTSALLIMTQHEPNPFNTIELNSNEDKNMKILTENQPTITTNPITIKKTEISSTNVAPDINSTIVTTDTAGPKIPQTSPIDYDNIPETMDTITDFTSPESKIISTEFHINSLSPEDINIPENSEILDTILPSTTIDSLSYSTSSNPKTTLLNNMMTNTISSTNIFKRAKMPRVTLKLRENDTIPQMYMKAGIASYKKGNITTSVLAHGLSLEGLIFKTPEGTIKPWSKKCDFTDSALYARLKRFSTQSRLLTNGVILIFCALMILSLIIIVKEKMIVRRWSNVEEPPLNNKEDEEQQDTSNLLTPETKLINENE